MPGTDAAARKPRSPGETRLPWVTGSPAVIGWRHDGAEQLRHVGLVFSEVDVLDEVLGQG
jgi:hypothetical protein